MHNNYHRLQWRNLRFITVFWNKYKYHDIRHGTVAFIMVYVMVFMLVIMKNHDDRHAECHDKHETYTKVSNIST